MAGYLSIIVTLLATFVQVYHVHSQFYHTQISSDALSLAYHCE